MERWVLAVDSRLERFAIMQREWIKYQTYVQMAPDMVSACQLLSQRDYLLVTIAGETVEYLPFLPLMRQIGPMPILVLAPKYNGPEKVEVIRQGADEYIEWPPTVEERLASARALIRRYTHLNHIPKEHVTTITYRDLLMAVEFRKVFVKNAEIKLTNSEFTVLHLLLSHPGGVHTYEQIYTHLNNTLETDMVGNYQHTVRSLMNRLRKKLRQGTPREEYIETIRGVGYCGAPPSSRMIVQASTL